MKSGFFITYSLFWQLIPNHKTFYPYPFYSEKKDRPYDYAIRCKGTQKSLPSPFK